jgi:nicotinamidase-related amidase
MNGPILLNLLTGNVCKKGSKGTGIDKRVNLVNDTIYHKSKNNALGNKELSRFLKENAISELYITGLFAEACVKATTKAALEKNYSATIIEDATGSKNTKKKLKSIGYCKRKGSNIILTDQLFIEADK